MRIAELARDSGYSPSFISQVESGRTVPSLSALAQIASALGSDLTDFFPRSAEPRVRVARAGDVNRLRMAPSATEEYTILNRRGLESPFTALVHRIYPTHEPVYERHPGERFALVLSGAARLAIGGRHYELGPGDAIHYASHTQHALQIVSNGPAEILWFVTPAIV